MKTNKQKGSVIPAIIAIVALIIIGGLYFMQKKTTIVSNAIQSDSTPIITSITPTSGPVGTTIKINGKNLGIGEGDYTVKFERSDGKKSGLFSFVDRVDTTLITATVKSPCEKGQILHSMYDSSTSTCDYFELTPGVYKVSVYPGIKGNELQFTVVATSSFINQSTN